MVEDHDSGRSMWQAMRELWCELSGLEMMRALVDGRVPHGEHHRMLVTLNLDIDFLRPIGLGERYSVDTEVVHAGRRRMLANGRICAAAG